MQQLMESVIIFFTENAAPLVLTILLLLGLFVLRPLIKKVILKHARINEVQPDREGYILKVVNILLFIVLVLAIGGVWGISLQGLSIYFASIFTLLGVALFATWSILSNITSSVIIFFFFPYKVGARVKVMDGDNSVEGKIQDISLFNVKIKDREDQIVSYPNNLIIQKAVRQMY